MSKNIVLCSDGTGQAGGQGFVSNVWRLFKAVDRHHATVKQVVFHGDGVGSETNKYVRAIGGAFGWGLSKDICDLYASLVRSYEPKDLDDPKSEDDQLYLFGFSRGAFAVRSLAGMIHHVGILDKKQFPSDEKLNKAVKSAYMDYRKEKDLGGDYEIHPKRMIKFVGVWDTVDAIGVPIDEMRTVIYAIAGIWRKRHKDELNHSIENAYHAISIDDERLTFHPMIWNEDPAKWNVRKDTIERKVEQVWFAGVHSNVGGGYPKDSLSYISLDWMMSKANGCGLEFLDSKWRNLGLGGRFGDYQEQADKNGRIYDSRGGWGVYYRYKPRNLEILWDKAQTHEKDKPSPTVHESALMRIQSGSTGYVPTALTGNFDTVSTWSDDIQSITGKPDLDVAWDKIGWRRVLYFGLVLWTLAFLLTGVFLDDGAGDPCEGRAICDGLTGLFKGMLPDFTYGWIDSYGANGWVFIGFMVVLAVMAKVRKILKRATESAASQAWQNVKINLLPKSTDENSSDGTDQ